MSFAVVRGATAVACRVSLCRDDGYRPDWNSGCVDCCRAPATGQQTGGGVTAMPPTLTLTGNPLSEQVPVTPL